MTLLPSKAINSFFERLAEKYVLKRSTDISFMNKDGTYKSIKQVLSEVAQEMKEKGGSE